MINAADVVFFVFLVGGAFTVVDKTGALRRAVDWLAERLLKDRRALVIPGDVRGFCFGWRAGEFAGGDRGDGARVACCCVDGWGSIRLTAAAMSIGAASVGSAFSPVNPFQAVLAQKLAGLPAVSGWGYRIAFFCSPALALWIWGTHRHAFRQHRSNKWPMPVPEHGASGGECSRCWRHGRAGNRHPRAGGGGIHGVHRSGCCWWGLGVRGNGGGVLS